jgi:hypothetical protein
MRICFWTHRYNVNKHTYTTIHTQEKINVNMEAWQCTQATAHIVKMGSKFREALGTCIAPSLLFITAIIFKTAKFGVWADLYTHLLQKLGFYILGVGKWFRGGLLEKEKREIEGVYVPILSSLKIRKFITDLPVLFIWRKNIICRCSSWLVKAWI